MSRRALIEQQFTAAFGGSPTRWVRAPGRAELLGSDTDDHLGYVMTMAIDLDTWIAYRPSGSPRCRIRSANLGESIEFEVGREPRERAATWDRYVNGVSQLLTERGLRLTGVDAVVHSTIPLGGGLSSSAALQVASAHMLLDAAGLSLEPLAIAQLCQQVEDRCVGVTCGILDQYSSVFGRRGAAVLLDCRSLSHVDVRIPAGIALVVCNSHVPRTLAGTQYAVRRSECDRGTALIRERFPWLNTLCDATQEVVDAMAELPEPMRDRCRFIAEENHRVLALTLALARDDRATIRRLLDDSFRGFGELYGKTVPAMEQLHSIMRSAPGSIGARQMGGGWGGCLIGYVDRTEVDAYVAHVGREFSRRIEETCTPHVAVPSAGAGTFTPA